MNINSSQRITNQGSRTSLTETGTGAKNNSETSAQEPTDRMTWSEAAGEAVVPALMTGAILGTGLVADHFLGKGVGSALTVVAGTAMCAGYAKATGRNTKLAALHGFSIGVSSAQLANLDLSTGIKAAGVVAGMGLVGGAVAHGARKV